jgi:iron-sulfur cluster repair protein YtfE (RIC family)
MTEEIAHEHKDIDAICSNCCARPPMANQQELESYSQELKVLLSTHFRKEEDALFPLTERILDRRRPARAWERK